jgi:hypothetical protein
MRLIVHEMERDKTTTADPSAPPQDDKFFLGALVYQPTASGHCTDL